MLVRLSVSNYALIDSLELELARGLNILTGETGAGKSILLGALGLLTGNRADLSVLKDSGANCVVEGVFNIDGYGLGEFFDRNDLDYDRTTVIRRIITPAGKSRAYVNDLPLPLSVLRELGDRLIDIHSQNQSLTLNDPLFRASLLDGLAVHGPTVARYRAAYREMGALGRELTQLRADAERDAREQEWLKHQCAELEAASLRSGELAELERQHNELSHSEEIHGAIALALSSLDEEEVGVMARIKNIQSDLSRVGDIFRTAAESAERLTGVHAELKDIFAELSSAYERVEADPARLQTVTERLDALHSLQQKHRVTTEQELIEIAQEYRQRLSSIEMTDGKIAELERLLGEKSREVSALAAEITAGRTAAAGKLRPEVEGLLSRLGMAAARFIVRLSAQEPGPYGADGIEFLFSSNNGVEPAPVGKIASGGETSRLMLALKSILAINQALPTIVFDEIDSGVSGRTAEAMGEIISELGGKMQILNITHLPQVAAKGNDHFYVHKEEENGVTVTRIKKLSPPERVEHIAAMLSGSRVTDAALIHARELLAQR